jgi:hypothetical protein
MNTKRILICALLISSIQTWTVEEESLSLPNEPLKVGNFANLLWPSNAFGFGEFIFEKGAIAPYMFLLHTKSENQYSTELYLQTGYGITDRASVLFSLPITINSRSQGTLGLGIFALECNFASQGVGDFEIQFEWAFYQKASKSSFTQATIVTSVAFPTGNYCPLIGISPGQGTYSLFFGGTLSHTTENWYAYLCDGITIATPRTSIELGSTVSYEAGIGRNLGNPWGTTLLAVLEINGIYIQKTKFGCINNSNSGSNTLFLGPTICWSIKNAQLFGGVQFPAYQHLNGTQPKQKYRLTFNAIAAF